LIAVRFSSIIEVKAESVFLDVSAHISAFN